MFAVPEANTDIGELKKYYSWFDYLYNVLIKSECFIPRYCVATLLLDLFHQGDIKLIRRIKRKQ